MTKVLANIFFITFIYYLIGVKMPMALFFVIMLVGAWLIDFVITNIKIGMEKSK